MNENIRKKCFYVFFTSIIPFSVIILFPYKILIFNLLIYIIWTIIGTVFVKNIIPKIEMSILSIIYIFLLIYHIFKNFSSFNDYIFENIILLALYTYLYFRLTKRQILKICVGILTFILLWSDYILVYTKLICSLNLIFRVLIDTSTLSFTIVSWIIIFESLSYNYNDDSILFKSKK